MGNQGFKQSLACLLLASGVAIPAWTQSSLVPSRVVKQVDDSRLVKLTGNTVPMARAEYEKGLVDAQLPLERMQLVLKRSPQQEAALEKFMAEQQDPKSPNFHHWLTPENFGKLYGPSDSDVAAVTSWLQNHGFQIYLVTKGRVTIEFSGTADQVRRTFHTEIHNYLVKGAAHIANNSDPQIPEALAPVITGIASLNNFFPKHQSIFGQYVKKDRKTGKITPLNPGSHGPTAQFTYTDAGGDGHEDITPWDFAAIYNLTPLWNAGITGAGQTIAISAVSDIEQSDINTFRNSFNLPAKTIQQIHNGTDPGVVSASQGENTLDTEWSGASAPEATVVLVVSGTTTTTFGGNLSDSYIVDNLVAPVMSASYGECEIALGTAGNAALNGIYQQGSAEGISMFESAGDQGSTGCDSSDNPAPSPAQYGLQVNGSASSPYITAVGGTDFDWQSSPSTYWNATNASDGATAKGYVPEIPWNGTCASAYLLAANSTTFSSSEELCNEVNVPGGTFEGLVNVAGGSGGVSACITSSGGKFATCGGGYPKPAWQTGIGVPNDGARDLPDVSLFASDGYPDGLDGSAYLLCMASGSPTNSCDYSNPEYIIYQEVGGTSVSSPAMAGIMALVLQKMGGAAQGLANPVFYKLAAQDNLGNCNASTENGSGCIFHDVTFGTNTQPCITGSINCVTEKAGDALGIVSKSTTAPLNGYNSTTGYDLATGLGSVNAYNLVNGWAAAVSTQAITLSPATLNFTSPAVGNASAAQTVTVSNTGSGALPVTISNVELDGTGYQSFSGTTTCPFAPATLAAGATCTVSVIFNPTVNGIQTVDLEVLDNATGSPQLALLSGSVGAAGAAPTTALQFVSVTPCRIADTRNANGPFGGPELGGGLTRAFDVPQSACNIPSSAVAYSLNVTVVPDGPLGYLAMWPSGQPQPVVSTLNSDGRVKANAAIVPAGTNGGVSVFVTNSSQVILDIDGYFALSGTASALAFYPVTPCRVVDTRNAMGPLGGPSLAAGASRSFPMQSSNCNLPATAMAYSLNVTSVPNGPLGYLSLWPSGQSQPLVSTLNAPTGTVTANAAIVPAGSGGAVSVYVSNASDVVLDVNGYFAAPGEGGLSLYTTTPCRVLDTRSSSGVFSGTLEVGVASSACAPSSTARAYVLNATVVPPAPLGYLTLWPHGEIQPNVSTLNASDGAITSNMAIVPTNDGNIDAYSTSANQLILDLSAYFAP
jgi:Pro-kumamolisin, activation domain/Abnormal spindle-like microcephaly-assoc'd, ASPM-SPD-2-Hydin